MKCNWEGCTDQAVRGRLHLCAKHRDENYLQKVKEANDRGTEKKRALRAANPVLCRVPGCKNPASTPKSHRCQACKDKLRADRWILYPKEKAMDANLGPREPPKPKPRKKKAPIMTDHEQALIDIEAQDRDRRRLKELGYGNGPVKVYRGAEAEAIPVTPIHLIPNRDFGVRESGLTFQ